jgi:hypothetical protein
MVILLINFLKEIKIFHFISCDKEISLIQLATRKQIFIIQVNVLKKIYKELFYSKLESLRDIFIGGKPKILSNLVLFLAFDLKITKKCKILAFGDDYEKLCLSFPTVFSKFDQIDIEDIQHSDENRQNIFV